MLRAFQASLATSMASTLCGIEFAGDAFSMSVPTLNDAPIDIYCRIQPGDPVGGAGGGPVRASFTVESAGHSDVGQLRENNEDSFLINSAKHLFVVADGMGGHPAGDEASRLAVAQIDEVFRVSVGDPFENRVEDLQSAVEVANQQIHSMGNNDQQKKGMGTTVDALHVDTTNGMICAAHVGDSRIYRIRKGVIRQLTQDHTLIALMKKMGRSEDDLKHAIARNVIVRSVGTSETVQVDLIRERLESGDVFLLCSDGLTGMLSDEVMLRMIDYSNDLTEAAEDLVSAANAAGGVDNITAVLVRASRVL